MKKEELKFISLAEAAKLTNYSQDYISLLCRQGKLRAEKLGRNWVTTKEWVYAYVDNTDGKGESVVPVRIKAAEPKQEVAAHEPEKNDRQEKEKNKFFGQHVLEVAFFCTACIVWPLNIYMLINYWRTGFFDDVPMSDAAIVDMSPVNVGAEVEDSCSSDGLGTVESLPAFEKETDPAVIVKVKEEIKARFSDDVEADVYKGFAIVNYKSSPERKFIYATEK